jgi:DNA repair exonuclease SbcCD ATPase subunit
VRLGQLRLEVDNIKNMLAALNRELGKLDQINNSKKLTEVNIQEYENSIKELEENIDIYNVLAEAFRDIPKQIFDKSVIAIQETANSIIQQVIPELSVNIYEDDSKLKRLIISFEFNGKERRYKRLSGGQRTVANIGIRLGFSQVIKRRADTNIELIVLDEPFGALDEENRELVKTVLAVVQEWFKQIIVISHVGGVETFPNVITVRYSPERGSYI